MKKEKFLFKILFLLFLFNFSLLNASVENKIIANVDDQIISSFELKNRIKAVLFLGKEELSQDNINKIKNEAMRYLINSKLKKIEINKFKISIEETKNVKDYLARIAQQFNTDIYGLRSKFNNADIDFELFLNDTKIEFAWRKLIFQIYNKKLGSTIDRNEIEKELNTIIKEQKNVLEYNLAEIEVLLDQKDNKEKIIKEIKDQINKIGFENTAIKYSNSSSAFEGGNLGWISSKSLSVKIKNIVENLNLGEVSDPVLQPNSLVFLKLLDKKKTSYENLNIEKIRQDIISARQNELLGLFATSHLSKIKNNALIQIK